MNGMLCIFVLLIPSTMIILGSILFLRPPKKINYFYGYRTSMSMLNEDTWNYGNKLCGKVWIVIGILEGILNMIILSFFNSPYDNVVSVLTIINVILLLFTLPIVEYYLMKNFHRNGKRK